MLVLVLKSELVRRKSSLSGSSESDVGSSSDAVGEGDAGRDRGRGRRLVCREGEAEGESLSDVRIAVSYAGGGVRSELASETDEVVTVEKRFLRRLGGVECSEAASRASIARVLSCSSDGRL